MIASSVESNDKKDSIDPLEDNIHQVEISIIKIGSIEIPSLGAGETAEATITWDIQPETYSPSVFVDSTRVVEESNERNNWAFISLL